MSKASHKNILDAPERGDFNEFGLAYLLAVYSAAKVEIPPCLNSMARNSAVFKGLAKPAVSTGRSPRNTNA